MGKRIDLTGQVFGRLTVLRQHGVKRGGNLSWLCLCECGKEHITASYHLRSGGCQSCGCFQREQASKASEAANTTHGMTKSATYMSWKSMLARCKHANVNGSERYLGRGIIVCERWHKFENFLADMGERPEGMSIDRIDNNLGYAPENCKWSTAKEQMNNRGNNRLITFGDRTHTAAQWADNLGGSWSLIANRIKMGWPIEDVLFKRPRKHVRK